MIKILLLTLTVILTCSVEVEATDWQLTIFDRDKEEHICAKDEASCRLAQEAIKNQYWPIAPKATETVCEIHPNCFLERSNCIKGFNCKINYADPTNGD